MVGAVTKRPEIEVVRILQSIRISSDPTTTEYTEGDALNLTGLAVTAVFFDGEELVTDYQTSPAEGEILDISDNEVIVSYTYNGTTVTASIEISVQEPYDITAKASGFTYGFEQCNNATDSYYFSGLSKYDSNWWRSTNKGVNSSTAGCVINLHLKKATTVTINVVDYQNESSYDYGTVGALDGSALSTSYSTDYSNSESSTVKWSGRSNHVSGGQTISFGTVAAGEHKIYVRYKKDGSAANNNDRLYFRVNLS